MLLLVEDDVCSPITCMRKSDTKGRLSNMSPFDRESEGIEIDKEK